MLRKITNRIWRIYDSFVILLLKINNVPLVSRCQVQDQDQLWLKFEGRIIRSSASEKDFYVYLPSWKKQLRQPKSKFAPAEKKNQPAKDQHWEPGSIWKNQQSEISYQIPQAQPQQKEQCSENFSQWQIKHRLSQTRSPDRTSQRRDRQDVETKTPEDVDILMTHNYFTSQL